MIFLEKGHGWYFQGPYMSNCVRVDTCVCVCIVRVYFLFFLKMLFIHFKWGEGMRVHTSERKERDKQSSEP